MSFKDALGADIREVQTRSHNGQPARAVILSRDYATTPDDLWAALTTPERISRWFLPVTGDLKPGGRYQLEGNAGGLIERCQAPDTLELTWEFGDNMSWVIVRLVAVGDATRLTLEHIMLKDEASEAHWKQYGPGATGVGWELGFFALGMHVAGNGGRIDPTEFEAWTGSSDGKAFAKFSAEAWGDAHIAAGTQVTKAHAMAARTSAFYRGE